MVSLCTGRFPHSRPPEDFDPGRDRPPMGLVHPDQGTPTSQRVYLAGPMHGIPEYNFPAFDAAAKEWRRAGWEVVSPAELDRVNHVHEFTNPLPENFLREAMKRDLAALCDCQAIALLPGWEKSRGVEVELKLATLLKLQVFDTKEPPFGEAE